MYHVISRCYNYDASEYKKFLKYDVYFLHDVIWGCGLHIRRRMVCSPDDSEHAMSDAHPSLTPGASRKVWSDVIITSLIIMSLYYAAVGLCGQLGSREAGKCCPVSYIARETPTTTHRSSFV